MVYKTDHVYAPASDTGIRWDSFSYPWPVEKPIISDHDQSFPPLNEFVSPWGI